MIAAALVLGSALAGPTLPPRPLPTCQVAEASSTATVPAPIMALAEAAPDSNRGPQRLCGILIESPSVPWPAAVDPAMVAALYPDVIVPWLEAVSYGRMTVASVRVTPVYQVSDAAWPSCPDGCTGSAIDISGALAAADADIDYRAECDFVTVWAGGYGGFAIRGRQDVQTEDGLVRLGMNVAGVGPYFIPPAYVRITLAGTALHELGHNFGAHHAGALWCAPNILLDAPYVRLPLGTNPGDGTCYLSDYANLYSVMGNVFYQGVLGEYGLAERWAMGLLDPGEVLVDPPAGTYTLAAVEESGGVKGVCLSRGSGGYLCAEVRAPLGADTAYAQWMVNGFAGVLATVSDDLGLYNLPFPPAAKPLLVDAHAPFGEDAGTAALEPGDTVVDPRTGASVRTVSRDAAAAVIAVAYPTTTTSSPTTSTLPTTTTTTTTTTSTTTTTTTLPCAPAKSKTCRCRRHPTASGCPGARALLRHRRGRRLHVGLP